MATVRIKGFVHYSREQSNFTDEKRPDVYVLPYRCDDDTFGVCVGEIDTEYALPEGFDLKAEAIRQRVMALRRQREEAVREHARRLAGIDQQLANLEAIEHTPATSGSAA